MSGINLAQGTTSVPTIVAAIRHLSAQAAFSANLASFDKIADAKNTLVGSDITYIILAGYYAVGDGGWAIYKRAAVQPSHPGKFQTADGAWWVIVGPNLHVRQFGAVCNGVADDTAAVNNAILSSQAFGGGTITLSGTTRMNGCLAIPYTGTNPPKQPFLRLTGEARDVDGIGLGIGLTSGTILDLRYDGLDGLHPAKIDTRGIGNLEIDHLTLKSGGLDNFLMLQSTNTTLNIHDVSVCGNPSNSGTSCAQDAFQLGGITSASATIQAAASTNGFQGYGTQFINMEFSHIRHAINFGGSANGVVVQNVTVDYTCGSAEPHGAPFTFYGVGLGTLSNYFYTVQIEVTNYKHGVAMFDGAIARVGGCGYNLFQVYIGDENGYTTSAFYIDNTNDNCTSNVIIPTFIGADIPLLSGTKSHTNAIIDPRPWVAYTPTITSTAGALTTYTILDANYKLIGRALHVYVRASFTDIGTGAGGLKITLPSPAATFSASVRGFNSSTNVSLGGLVNYDDLSTFRVYKYDGTFPVANTQTLFINVMCEV